eukprot:scaffold41230_cov72-Phaeocystis_antarctica.AAC.1
MWWRARSRERSRPRRRPPHVAAPQVPAAAAAVAAARRRRRRRPRPFCQSWPDPELWPWRGARRCLLKKRHLLARCRAARAHPARRAAPRPPRREAVSTCAA